MRPKPPGLARAERHEIRRRRQPDQIAVDMLDRDAGTGFRLGQRRGIEIKRPIAARQCGDGVIGQGQFADEAPFAEAVRQHFEADRQLAAAGRHRSQEPPAAAHEQRRAEPGCRQKFPPIDLFCPSRHLKPPRSSDRYARWHRRRGITVYERDSGKDASKSSFSSEPGDRTIVTKMSEFGGLLVVKESEPLKRVPNMGISLCFCLRNI